MHYRTATEEDAPRLLRLDKAVSRVRDGIARLEHEVTEEYIHKILHNSLKRGLMVVAEHPDDPNELVADMHGYTMGLEIFKHLITDVTVCVHPEFQGRKIGRTILTIYLDEIVRNRPEIGKVELIAREGNLRAIHLYQSVGFRIEGRLEMRIRMADGTYEADIPMGWQNPSFEFDMP